ncbi:transposase [Mesorhizobium sp. CCANP35]|uniref:Transposase n=2 Tax=Mesorhizobium neociceri TaxID=1307853 RepID=A0A838B6S5_9HYPH|nr:transposase [Mesorhizobium neociceri]
MALEPDADGFKSGRHFAAWLGLTTTSIRAAARSGSEEPQKIGYPVLRSLPVLGATTSMSRRAKDTPDAPR